MTGAEQLDDLIARLERAAEQLRSGELSADAAATMVEDCAALATQAAAELEQLSRAEVVGAAAGPGHAAVGARWLLVSATYPENLREDVEALPAATALLRGGADGRAGGGDALLAARRRQAHPPGARAGDRARGRAWNRAR